MIHALATPSNRVAVKTVTSGDLRDSGGPYIVGGRIAYKVVDASAETALSVSHHAMPVYPVSEAEIDSGRFVVSSGLPLRVIDIDVGGIERPIIGNIAIPVYYG